MEVTADVDVYVDEVLNEVTDEDLVVEVEERGYEVLTSPDSMAGRRTPDQNLHEELCSMFDLSRAGTTKTDLLKRFSKINIKAVLRSNLLTKAQQKHVL